MKLLEPKACPWNTEIVIEIVRDSLATSGCVIRVLFARLAFELATRFRHLLSAVFLFKIVEIGMDTPTNYFTLAEI